MAFGNVFRNFYHVLRAEGFVFKAHRRFGMSAINKTGVTIAADKLVAVSGYDVTSKRPKIVLADADAVGLATDVWYTPLAIKDGKIGNIFQGGMSQANIDTSGATTVGDPIFLSTTAGAFTSTAPTATNARQLPVGFVHVKSSTVGQIKWDIPENSNKISSTDVSRVTGRTVAATAAVASVATFTPATDGSFDICMNVLVTTSTTHTFTAQCTYTDEGNTGRTVTMPFRLVGDTTALTSSIQQATAVPYHGVPLRIRAKAATAITLLTQAAGTYTTVTFNVEGSIEQIS